MKKSLYLFLVYIVIFLFMSAVVAYLHMQEIQLTLLVAGTKLPFINFKLFVRGLLFYFPLCSALSLLPFCFYLIRHKFKLVQYLIPYIIICIIVFLVFFPLGIELQENFSDFLSPIQKELTPLSSGYFRTSDTFIDYYISTNPDGSSEILHISRPSNTHLTTEFSTRTVYQTLAGTNGFSDPLIYDVFGSDNHLAFLKSYLRFLELKMKESYYEGFWNFFGFMSIGFALSSVIGLRRVANWRLLNLINMLLSYFGIIVINVILYSHQFYKTFPFLAGAKIWLPIAINALIFLSFTILGIFCAVSKLDPNRESD